MTKGKPASAEAWARLGFNLCAGRRPGEGMAAYASSLELCPAQPAVWNNLGEALWAQRKLADAQRCFRQALELRPDFVTAHSNLLLAMNYDPAHSAADLADAHRAWARVHAGAPPPAPRQARRDGKLRIGYVSHGLRTHTNGFFIRPVLAAHHRPDFHITCYSNSTAQDPKTADIRRLSDRWREIAGLDDDAVAALIRRDRIDVLVDLCGHAGAHRLLVFARRPAPVQVTWLGYPNTTGMEAMDYRITDGLADPPGMTEHLHSEQLVRLEDGFLCFAGREWAAPGPLPALRKRRVTFGSFQILPKITDAMIGNWSAVLEAVPRSRLMIKSRALGERAIRRELEVAFAAHGMGRGRLDLRDFVPSDSDYMRLFDEVDIALDTYPYHGTTTTFESLWMGVPVVTLAGRTHVSRVGVSLLTRIGLERMVAGTPEEYVQIAVDQARDLSGLAKLRRELRARLEASPMTDATRFTTSLENAYRRMWAERAH